MSDDKICPRCHQSTEPGWIDERVPKLEARVRELEAEILGDVQAWEQHSRELHQQIHYLEAELIDERMRRINAELCAEAERDALRALLRDAGYALPSGLLRDRIDAALGESK